MAGKFAPGIKDKRKFGDLDRLQPGQLLDYVRQLHIARKAGRHFDYRFGTPETGLFSWATRKDYPEAGKSIGMFRQPVHDYDYKDFEGMIPPGYGQGPVSKVDEGKLLVTRKGDRNLSFTTANGSTPQRFAVVGSGSGRDWKHALLVKSRGVKSPPVGKPQVKDVLAGKQQQFLEQLPPDAPVEPKYDGASTLVHLLKNRDVEMLSHRKSKRTGEPIVHTERFFRERPNLKDLPAKYKDSVLLGEMLGVRDGKAIPLQELGGILNSVLAKSIQKQDAQGVDLKTILFALAQQKGKPVQMSYDQQRETLQDILRYLPEGKFELSEKGHGPEDARRWLQQMKKNQHPMTSEGVVVHTDKGARKIKLQKEHDVYTRSVFPGEGKYKGKAAGGFYYSTSADGPVVGKVGIGLSDEMRKMLHENPDVFLNRVARIRSQGQYPSGAHRVPSFLALHESR